MPDIFHQWGGDLSLSLTGGIALADGTTLTRQRLLRRLMTNPGDYIWHPDYGAGLGRFVGRPADINANLIASLVRQQCALESTIARVPEPSVTIRVDPSGTVGLRIAYVDAATAAPQTLSFDYDPSGAVTETS
jgi:phage baseplate assembly protein W